MIVQYKFKLSYSAETRLPSGSAYRMYAWLLEQIDTEYGEQLHEQGEKPISQYTMFDRTTKNHYWVVNLLTAEIAELIEPILRDAKHVNLHDLTVELSDVTVTRFETTAEFIQYVKNMDYTAWQTVQFMSPTAFKQNGRYAIMPSEQLFLHSVVQKWNTYCGDFPIDDEDALEMLASGIHITSYRLKSTRYQMKQMFVPGFLGEVRFEARLAPPMQELWKLLLSFAAYSGIGIKTTLGMGGVSLSPG